MRAAKANKGARGARNRVDAEAIGRAAAEFGGAAEAAARAAAALAGAARLGRMEADELERAAEAHARAADAGRERAGGEGKAARRLEGASGPSVHWRARAGAEAATWMWPAAERAGATEARP